MPYTPAQSAEQIHFGRQAILDWNRKVVAYELLFRHSGTADSARISDDMNATAHVINHAFFELAIEDALGPYPAFINSSAGLLMSDVVMLLPKDKIVLEVLETVAITPEFIERLRELRAAGFSLALDDFAGDEARYAEVLPLVSVVKLDMLQLKEDQLVPLLARLRKPGVQLLAEKIDQEAQFERCRALGFDLFQGYFFARPTIITGKRLNPSEAVLLQLLGLIMKDAGTIDLEAVFKQAPGLSVNLMRLTNSVSSGSLKKITSLRDAIVRLGREQLQRWLQLLLFTNPTSGTAGPLLQIAATRGRIMELIAEELWPRKAETADAAFMVGIMSLMPALLGIPLEEVLKPLPVSAEIRAALESRAGTLGALLAVAEACENAPDAPPLSKSLDALQPLDVRAVNRLQVQAMIWANQISV